MSTADTNIQNHKIKLKNKLNLKYFKTNVNIFGIKVGT